jgi:tRNA(His) 5'-end guanylyltransferase
MNDELGDRMKFLEGQESDRRFMPLVPICARLDGKNFSKFTRGLERPYDKRFSDLMIATTSYLVEETNACIGYTQSDEISLIYYSEDTKSQVFFDGRIQKMCSVLASMCSVKFNTLIKKMYDELGGSSSDVVKGWERKLNLMPIFDCRVWVVPNKVEAVNTLVWREQDCFKNSVSMAAREHYSDKELFKKSGSDKQELLFKKGINHNDYPNFFKRGTYIQRRKVTRKFTTEEMDKLPEKHEARTNPDLMVERTEIRVIDMPPITQVINRVEVVFEGQDPVKKDILPKNLLDLLIQKI